MANQTRPGGVYFVAMVLLLGSFFSLFHWVEVSADTPATATPIAQPTLEISSVYLPFVQAIAIQATPTPTTFAIAVPALPPRQWDPRLDAREINLRSAQFAPGQGHWRLVRAVWYDEEESEGRHHVLVDVLDADGQRIVDVPIRFYWGSGETILRTQAKPGEAYAADFGMFNVAPSYGASPADGQPADDVWGMGLGSIEQPKYTIHSSYGLVWQWTVTGSPATPLPSSTPTPSTTPTDALTAQTPVVTPMPTATPTATPMATSTLSLPSRQWDPRLDQRGTELRPADIAPGQGYWRLVQGAWHDEQASRGRHHIFVDVRDEHGNRIVGVPIRFYWNGGEATVYTEEKPGEAAAASFGMNEIAPSYGAIPADGHPADNVWGMGLGSIAQPHYAIPTSYTLLWQWTIMPGPPLDKHRLSPANDAKH